MRQLYPPYHPENYSQVAQVCENKNEGQIFWFCLVTRRVIDYFREKERREISHVQPPQRFLHPQIGC